MMANIHACAYVMYTFLHYVIMSQFILNNNFLQTDQEQVSGVERFKCERESK